MLHLLHSGSLVPGAAFSTGCTTSSHIIVSDAEKFLYVLSAQGKLIHSIENTDFINSIIPASNPSTENGYEELICGRSDATIQVFSLAAGYVIF
jgi:hypothetical protein